MPNSAAAATARLRSRLAIAVTRPFADPMSAGMTYARPICAAPRMPQRSVSLTAGLRRVSGLLHELTHLVGRRLQRGLRCRAPAGSVVNRYPHSVVDIGVVLEARPSDADAQRLFKHRVEL